MTTEISPTKLFGEVKIPPSKSYAHRMIIAAGLSSGFTQIKNIALSADITATANAMSALGAKTDFEDSICNISGVSYDAVNNAVIDCNESGSTLRFLIPIVAALGCKNCKFIGKGGLPNRPITAYRRELSSHGISFSTDSFPFEISGKLTGGDYKIEGNVSSQFITGLLFALPICTENSVIYIDGKLESKPYVDMTIEVLNKFGIAINEFTAENGDLCYKIAGNQFYKNCESVSVEGDFSQAAFFYVANALGSNITLQNLNENSLQGDKKIVEIMEQIGYNKVTATKYSPFEISVADIPDLVPILSVLASVCDGISVLYDAARLKIKESDRLLSTSTALNSIGGNIEVFDDKLVIHPIKKFTGGKADGFNDHRIVMALAIASTFAENPVTITGSEAVTKSYPSFWKDFSDLGGNFTTI